MSISIDFTAKVLHRKTFMEAEDYNIHIWDEGLRVEL